MMKFILWLLLVCACPTMPLGKAFASGSTTVYLKIDDEHYALLKTLWRPPYWSDDLIPSPTREEILTAVVSPQYYSFAKQRVQCDPWIVIVFQGYEPIAFRYLPELDAIIGVTESGQVILLRPSYRLVP